MPETEVLTRPNGKPYRPRKVVARFLSGDAPDYDEFSGVIVTGTHDQERAATLARALVASEFGEGYEPVYSGGGWWHDGMEHGQRCWVADDERGQAGVIFGKIAEAGEQ
ncbi:MAG: hypothetical protein M3Y33_08545 [Actinomycetota bacterium]|nr:hypothetical protein [Actinomycetota bacterium]